jgi:hypothetical protein
MFQKFFRERREKARRGNGGGDYAGSGEEVFSCKWHWDVKSVEEFRAILAAAAAAAGAEGPGGAELLLESATTVDRAAAAEGQRWGGLVLESATTAGRDPAHSCRTKS